MKLALGTFVSLGIFCAPIHATDNDGTGSSTRNDSHVVTKVDWAQVKRIVPAATASSSVPPDAASEPMNPLVTKSITLTPEFAGGNRVNRLLFDRKRGHAWAVTHEMGTREGATIQHIDLVSGHAGHPVRFPSLMEPTDMHSATGRLLACTFADGKAETAISVWSSDSDTVRHERTITLGDLGDRIPRGEPYAKFIDADHILFSTSPQTVAMIQLSKARAVYQMDVESTPALSANGKHFAVQLNDAIYICDALTGESIGRLPGNPGRATALSFRPDGKQLACVSSEGMARRLLVWNLVTVELYRDIYYGYHFVQEGVFTSHAAAANIARSTYTRRIDWVDEGYLLLGGDEKLVDLERRLVLWTYRSYGPWAFDPGCGVIGGRFWYAMRTKDGMQRVLSSAKLPHPMAVKTAAALNADEVLAVKPGVEVNLIVTFKGADEDQQRVLQVLRTQLQELGMSVGHGSRLKLVATMEFDGNPSVHYKTFDDREGETITSVYNARLAFIEGDKVVWKAFAIGRAPRSLTLKRGETLQEALSQFKKPNVSFFSEIKMPKYVVRPGPARGAYGNSNLTDRGVDASAEAVRGQLESDPQFREHVGQIELIKVNLSESDWPSVGKIDGDVWVYDVAGTKWSGPLSVKLDSGPDGTQRAIWAQFELPGEKVIELRPHAAIDSP